MTRRALATWIQRERRLIAILGPFTLVSAVGLALMSLADRDPAPYVATLDSLPIPSTWTVMHTDARRGDFLSPTRATRYYLVEAEPEDAARALKDAMRAAGFEIYVRMSSDDSCDLHPRGSLLASCPVTAVDDCRENGPGGPISCWVEAFRRIDGDPEHLEHLYSSLSPRGSTIDHGPSASPRYVQDPDLALLVITADLSYPRHFWSAPTPSPAGDAIEQRRQREAARIECHARRRRRRAIAQPKPRPAVPSIAGVSP